MWIVTFVVSVLWVSGVNGQSIELHTYNSSLANRPNVCRWNLLLPDDWFLMTATLNATGTSRDEWPLDKIILREKVYGYSSCGQNNLVKNISPICEINIARDGCGKPTPGKCGYCDSKRDDLYHLVFNITATEESFKRTGFKTIQLTWAGESSETYYPRVTTRDFILNFPVKLDTKLDVFDVNGSVASRQYDTKIIQAPSACASPRLNGKVDHSTWYLPTETIHEDGPCLDKTIYYQLITELPLTLNIRAHYYDYYCPREGFLSSPLFQGYVRDMECEMKTVQVDNSTWVIWVCTPPTYGLCISLGATDTVFTPSIRCMPFFVQEINDTTFFAKYSVALWKLEEQIWPNFTLSHTFVYDISQYTECTNDTGVYKFTVNESQSAIVRPGDKVTFSCEIYGFPIPNAQLLGPATGQLKTHKAMVYLLNYTLDNLQCEDSGRYVCKVDRGYGDTIEARQKFVDINVMCPPKVNVSLPGGQTPTFTYNLDEGITIEVYGYPAPTNFILRLKEGNSTSQEVDKELYSVIITPLAPPLFRLTLNFHKLLDQRKSTTLVMQVNNGEGSGLDLNLVVMWNISRPESLPAWLNAVVTASCALTIVITIVLFLYCVRRTTKKTRSNNSATNKERNSLDHTPARRNDSQRRHRRHEHHKAALSSPGSTSITLTLQRKQHRQPNDVCQKMDEDRYVSL